MRSRYGKSVIKGIAIKKRNLKELFVILYKKALFSLSVFTYFPLHNRVEYGRISINDEQVSLSERPVKTSVRGRNTWEANIMW